MLESAGGRSRSGPSRNADYRPALDLILERLKVRRALLVAALVDSRQTADLPESDRALIDDTVDLATVGDLVALRLRLTTGQGRIGQAPGAPKAGNNSKRLRLRVAVPGYGPADAPRLATEISASSTAKAVEAAPAQRQPAGAGTVRINEWWRDDPAECYWMEITNREDLGANVRALQRDGSGRENWSYTLVTALRPGDIVLHWHKERDRTPGIVGYSRAAEGPFDDALVWNARGSYGQSRAPIDEPQPAWRYDLTGYTPLPAPVDQAAFQRAEAALQEIKRNLEATHPGPLYFPFAFFASRPLRAMQAYLVKFPAAILDAVPELSVIPCTRQSPVPTANDRPTAAGRSGKSRPGGSGYLSDPVLKLALERHAVARAAELYPGYDVRDVGATRSYDLDVTWNTEEIHVEVKGSSGTADAVELTSNEVDHASTAATHLVVVDQIEWSRLPDGQIKTHGGRVRRWTTWVPHSEDLQPTRYRYRLPDDGSLLPAADGESRVTRAWPGA